MAYLFRYGKHAGSSIEDVPEDYLEWMVADAEKRLLAAKGELERRRAITESDLTWSEKVVNAGFRSLATKHHPDAGGNADDFKRLQAAVAQLRHIMKELQIG